MKTKGQSFGIRVILKRISKAEDETTCESRYNHVRRPDTFSARTACDSHLRSCPSHLGQLNKPGEVTRMVWNLNLIIISLCFEKMLCGKTWGLPHQGGEVTKLRTGNIFSHLLHGCHNSRFFKWIISFECHDSIIITDALVIPILEMQELRLSDAKYCGQGHRACEWQI